MPDVERTVRPAPGVLDEWDELVEGAPACDVAQLSAWAEIRSSVGFTPAHILVRDGGRLVAGAQILARRVPAVGTIGYLPYGPVISPTVDRDRVRAVVTSELAAVAERMRMLFVQPPLGAEDVSEDLLRRGFRGSDAEIAPAATLRLDVRATDAELRAGLSRRTRTWTRQWPHRGVTVRVGGRDDIALLAGLLGATARHHAFTPLPAEYLTALYDRLAGSGRALVLVGEVNGRPAAAELFTACGDVVTARICGFDRDETTARLNVPGAITWTALRWAREHGYHVFDLGGLDRDSVRMLDAEPDCDPPRFEGPDRFKAKFGGRVVRYPPAVELLPSPVVRTLYDRVRGHPGGRRLVAAARAAMRGGGSPREAARTVKRSPAASRAPAEAASS